MDTVSARAQLTKTKTIHSTDKDAVIFFAGPLPFRTPEGQEPPLGTVMINLQQTSQDGKMTLRLFGTSDATLRMLLGELGLPTRFTAPVFPKERRVLVPYDADGNRAAPGAPRMWWDLSSRAQIKVTCTRRLLWL